jgi:hypothetical protein
LLGLSVMKGFFACLLACLVGDEGRPVAVVMSGAVVVVVITSGSPIWKEVSMSGYVPHIIICSLVGFTLHTIVPVTVLDTKEAARRTRRTC